MNYVDRDNLSVAAPLLKDELHISGAQLGILLSAFLWTYTEHAVRERLAGGPVQCHRGNCGGISDMAGGHHGNRIRTGVHAADHCSSVLV
ncbi:MAG TPA: hypothetical protein VJ756_01385 [Terriglobales bacterium]|nr:hypothetical protein [Terriglobales bacterium]